MKDLLLTDPELVNALEGAGIRSAEDLFALERDAGSSRRVRVTLAVPGTVGEFHLKCYTYAGWRTARGLIGRGTLWGAAPELREFRALAWLREHGLPAVRPVAAAARTHAGRLVAHALLTEHVPGSENLAVRLETDRDDVLADAALRRRLVQRVGGALAQMHALGFRHRDCHARNVLVRREGDDVAFWFLDCRRGGVGGIRRGPLYDLACLDLDLRGRLGRADRVRGLCAYEPEASRRKPLLVRLARLRSRLARARSRRAARSRR